MNPATFCEIEHVLGHAAPWIATYTVHSTVMVALIWCITRKLSRCHLAAVHLLWRSTLVIPVVSTLVAQSPWFERNAIAPTWTFDMRHSPEVGDSATLRAQSGPVSQLNDSTPTHHNPATRGRHALALEPVSTQPLALPSIAALEVNEAVEPVVNEPAHEHQPWWMLTVIALALASLSIRRTLHEHCRSRSLINECILVTQGPIIDWSEELAGKAGLATAPTILLHPHITSPLALTYGRIVVPQRFVESPQSRLVRAALAHEIAHLARRDPQWYAAAHWLQALLGFAPLQHQIVKQLHQSMEPLCDDWAVALLGDNVELAKCLAWVASWSTHSVSSPYLTAMSMNKHSLVERVTHILGERAGTLPRNGGLHTLAIALILGSAIVVTAPTFALANPSAAAVPAAPPSPAQPNVQTPLPSLTPQAPAVKAVAPVPPAPAVKKAPSKTPRAPVPAKLPAHVMNLPSPPVPPVGELIAAMNLPELVQGALNASLPLINRETAALAQAAQAIESKARAVVSLENQLRTHQGDAKKREELQRALAQAQAQLEAQEKAIEAQGEAIGAKIEAEAKKLEAWGEAFEKEIEPKIEAMAAKHAAEWEKWAQSLEAQIENDVKIAEQAQHIAAEKAKAAAIKASAHHPKPPAVKHAPVK